MSQICWKRDRRGAVENSRAIQEHVCKEVIILIDHEISVDKEGNEGGPALTELPDSTLTLEL